MGSIPTVASKRLRDTSDKLAGEGSRGGTAASRGMGYMKEGLLKVSTLLLAAVGLATAALASPIGAGAANPTYNIRQIQANTYGGEPSIASDGNGVLYYDSPSQGLQMWYSLDHGLNWTASTTDPDATSGDNCLATDQSNAVYQCNLNGSQSAGPLQADVWKTVDKGTTWIYGNNPINLGGQNLCGTSRTRARSVRPPADRNYLWKNGRSGICHGATDRRR